MTFRMLPPAAALAAVLVLAGCVPSEPIITPEPAPDATPVFASDEDALAAATEAYARYLDVSDQIRSQGGKEPQRIAEFVTQDQLAVELSGFQSFADKGYSTVGEVIADSAELQQYVDNVDGSATVVIYTCLDATQVKVIDAEGAIVDFPERQDRQLFEVSFSSVPNAASKLLLSGSELWSNNDC